MRVFVMMDGAGRSASLTLAKIWVFHAVQTGYVLPSVILRHNANATWVIQANIATYHAIFCALVMAEYTPTAVMQIWDLKLFFMVVV